MSAPLSNRQKGILCQLSERAFNKLGALARGRGETFYAGPDQKLEREKFRHAEVAKACGKNGLRCCSQSDYKIVEAHFLELLGEHGRAFNAQVRAATEERRLIEHKIVEACNEFGYNIGYADTICRNQNHGKGIEEIDTASAEGLKRLWQVFFTVRNRGIARQRKEKEMAHV